MTGLVIRPVRFTDQLSEMQRFLELIGLRPWIVSKSGGWCDMACGCGRVALHEAKSSSGGNLPGQTTLSFEADDVTALAKQLTDSGLAAADVFDEAYGRVLTCEDPAGDIVAVDERMDDFYGYRVLADTATRASLRVMPVRFADPAGSYGSFLQTIGLEPAGDINPYYVNFRADDGEQGQVGLHHETDDPPVVTGGRAAAVQLTFESAEPLTDLAARLSGAGFLAQIVTEDFGSFVVVTDPDGQPVQVHAPAA